MVRYLGLTCFTGSRRIEMRDEVQLDAESPERFEVERLQRVWWEAELQRRRILEKLAAHGRRQKEPRAETEREKLIVEAEPSGDDASLPYLADLLRELQALASHEEAARESYKGALARLLSTQKRPPVQVEWWRGPNPIYK
jgi:hypothetical protein